MATTTTTISTKVQTHPRRRKCRETTISSAAPANSASGYSNSRKLGPPTVVFDNSWCFPASIPISSPSPPQSRRSPVKESDLVPDPLSNFKIRMSPGSLSPVMDFVPSGRHSPRDPSNFPSSFTNFNSALSAGLLNPMSPPPDKHPTLLEMMANEPEIQLNQIQTPIYNGNANSLRSSQCIQMCVQDEQVAVMQRISELLGSRSPGNLFNDASSSDMKLTLSSKDGINVSMNVHRQILVAHSRFFAVQLSDRWAKQQRSSPPYMVEIADCNDVEVYIETLRLMYCKDLRRKLMRADVNTVLGILKVSAAIGFDAGVLSCLEYLEAAPWAEDEEEKVASLLSELRLEGVGAGEVLKRVSVEVANGAEESSDNDKVLLKVLQVVLEGKDEKARREMKGLVSKMLRENSAQSDIKKESLYSACDGCLQLLSTHFLRAAAGDLEDVGLVARQADNLYWILDIMIDRQIAEDFLKIWASQSELSGAHSKIPAVHRYEISQVTARLFVGIGKGQLLASKEDRWRLLETWLVPFYDDFGWMRRASKGLDRHLIEDGLSNTILTLPLEWQQDILLAWFDRFLNSGDDCPNIQRGFEMWWRRAIWRRGGHLQRARPLRIVSATIENS